MVYTAVLFLSIAKRVDSHASENYHCNQYNQLILGDITVFQNNSMPREAEN